MTSLKKPVFFSLLVNKTIKAVLLSLLLFSTLFAQTTIPLNEKKILNDLLESYGERAKKRGQAWFKLMNPKEALSNQDKLHRVNQFFNTFHFIDDKRLWGQSNYWATPIEFIGANAGDCEDYSIAKYFTLLELGIDNKKLRITMVKALSLNQYHMVLAYYETPTSIPLILDNIDGMIKKANKRNDLVPIFSFNATQLWLNKEKGRGILSGKSSKLKLWNDLRQRIINTQLKQPLLKTEF